MAMVTSLRCLLSLYIACIVTVSRYLSLLVIVTKEPLGLNKAKKTSEV